MGTSTHTKSLKPKKGEKREKDRVQLEGIWKGVKIPNKDISKVRKTLLDRIGKKW